MNDIKLRVARPSDAAELLALYAPYVEDTAISFETVVPRLEEFTERMVHKLPRYPYSLYSRGERRRAFGLCLSEPICRARCLRLGSGDDDISSARLPPHRYRENAVHGA